MSPIVNPSGVQDALTRNSVMQDKITLGGRPVISWTYDPLQVADKNAPTQGTVWGTSLGLFAGDVITNIVVSIAVAASGTVPTVIRLGLLDSGGVLRATTANLNSSAVWTNASLGPCVCPLSATYTAPTTDIYVPVFIQVGAFSVTQPSLHRASAQGQTGGSALAFAFVPSRGSNYGSGLSDLPSIGSTLTAGPNGATFWFCLT